MKLNKSGNKRGFYKRTEESNNRMSEIKKAYKPTEETKLKLSIKIKWMHDNDLEYQKKCLETNYKKSNRGHKNGMYGKKRPYLAKWNKENPLIGPQNPAWRGGKKFEPYGFEFNKQLKATVKKRDNYTCMFCFVKENIITHHQVHHIDYDKRNNNPDNLITLCNHCHGKTNFNRYEWRKYLEKRMVELYG